MTRSRLWLIGATAFAGLLSWAGLPDATAHDLGVMGRTWPIAEVNILKLLVESAAQVNWHQVQQGMLKQAENWGSHLPQWRFPDAKTTKTVWFDPAITLKKPVYGPKKSRTGNYEWGLLYAAGTRVNPLRYERPPSDMLFFNGTDPAQVNFAIAAYKAHETSLYLVETAGNPEILAKKLDMPVYYANQGILARFPVRKLPTLMGVGSGAHAFNLALTQFAPNDYTQKMLNAAWNGLDGVQGDKPMIVSPYTAQAKDADHAHP